jgi:hypothetical protein
LTSFTITSLVPEGDDRFYVNLIQFSFLTVTSIRTHLHACARASASFTLCQFPFAGIAILLTGAALPGPYNESAISTAYVEMAERAPLSPLNPLRTPLTTASHLQPAEKSTSTPVRWGYLLAEMALIVLFTYLVFFATPHSGLYTPLTLAITTALFTLFTLFYLFKAAPADPRLAYPVLAAVAILILTSLTSIDPRRSLAETWLIAMPFFLGFVLLEFGRRGLPGELVVKSLLVPGGLIMAMSWAQALFWYRSWLADFPGEWIPSISYRLPAPNFLAVMFNLLLMLALARLLASASRLSRLILALYCLSALGLLFLTSSRGGWIGTAAGLFCLALLLLRFQRTRLLPLWDHLRASPLLLRFQRTRLLLAPALLLALAVFFAVGYLLYRQAVHPTHVSRPGLARLPLAARPDRISRKPPPWPRPPHLRILLHAPALCPRLPPCSTTPTTSILTCSLLPACSDWPPLAGCSLACCAPSGAASPPPTPSSPSVVVGACAALDRLPRPRSL